MFVIEQNQVNSGAIQILFSDPDQRLLEEMEDSSTSPHDVVRKLKQHLALESTIINDRETIEATKKDQGGLEKRRELQVTSTLQVISTLHVAFEKVLFEVRRRKRTRPPVPIRNVISELLLTP